MITRHNMINWNSFKIEIVVFKINNYDNAIIEHVSYCLQRGPPLTYAMTSKRSFENRKFTSCHPAFSKQNRLHPKHASAFWKAAMITESWLNMSIRTFKQALITRVPTASSCLRANWAPMKRTWRKRQRCAGDGPSTTTCTRVISESLLKMQIQEEVDLYPNYLVSTNY